VSPGEIADIKAHVKALEKALNEADEDRAHTEARRLVLLLESIEPVTPFRRNVRAHVTVDLIVEGTSLEQIDGKVDQLIGMGESSGIDYIGTQTHLVEATAWGWNDEKDSFEVSCPNCGDISEAHTSHACPEAKRCDDCGRVPDFFTYQVKSEKP
jgi:predicted RNA-binding Zn-ribbon protein involved in translation (DUF1610 family)